MKACLKNLVCKENTLQTMRKKLEQDDKEKFHQVFSKILSSGMNPSEYPSHFETVKSSIENGASS